jgi:hypothetical protein
MDEDRAENLGFKAEHLLAAKGVDLGDCAGQDIMGI